MKVAGRKKEVIKKVALLVVGVGIGWGWGEYRSRCMLDHLWKTWTPEFQEFITESVRIGDILEEVSTEEDIHKIVILGKKMYSDWNSQTFAKAYYSLFIKKKLREGEIEDAISFSESSLELFLERYDAGYFKGDINDEAAGKLAEAIKSAEGSEYQRHRVSPSMGTVNRLGL